MAYGKKGTCHTESRSRRLGPPSWRDKDLHPVNHLRSIVGRVIGLP